MNDNSPTNDNTPMSDAARHRDVMDLLPWYVNDTLDDQDRLRVEEHLPHCAACRLDLTVERQVYEAMTTATAVEYMPAPSLKRLHARLDALESPGGTDEGEGATVRVVSPARRWLRWQGLTAASVAVMALALAFLAADLGLRSREASAPPVYHTVTTTEPRPADAVIRAVFAPNTTMVELKALLDEARLRIVAGPTESGVYSLAADSTRPLAESLAALRRHNSVRFAESIQ